MNVSDVLVLPSFEGAQVISGTAGLGREVTTAMVVEAPDIDVWGKRGQLLITSFYAFEKLDEAGLEAFFEKADQIGIGALVFKPERLVAEAPQAIRDLCDRHALPLIRVPGSTKYEGLLLDVLGNFLDSNLTLLNRFFDLHRQTMELALREPTLLEILMRLRGLVHADITFLDCVKDRRTTTSDELSRFEHPRLTELEANEYRTHRYFDAELTYPELTRMATAVLVPSTDEQFYYLILHIKSERLTPLDIMAVENVVSLLQMEVLKQNALDRKVFFANNNIARELLCDRDLDSAQAADDLKALGIDAFPHYEVLLLSVKLEDPSEVDRQSDVFLMARRRLKMLYPTTAYLETNYSITFLHNVRSQAARFDVSAIEEIMAEVANVPAMPQFAYTASLSSLGDAASICSLNREATDVARFFEGSNRTNSCLRYEDMGIYKLFMQVADASELTQFVDPRVATLHDDSPEFFETASALCENNLNYQQTARDLYVHPKTIRYRAERIQKLYGLDFHNLDDRMQIALAARIYRLLKSKA